jgi:hypothetical protein
MSGSVQIGAPTLRLSQAGLAGLTAGIKCTDRAESSWTDSSLSRSAYGGTAVAAVTRLPRKLGRRGSKPVPA